MKRQLQALCLLVGLFPLALNAQMELKRGFIVTENNQRIEGQLKELFKKGRLMVSLPDNTKKTLGPSEVKIFSWMVSTISPIAMIFTGK